MKTLCKTWIGIFFSLLTATLSFAQAPGNIVFDKVIADTGPVTHCSVKLKSDPIIETKELSTVDITGLHWESTCENGVTSKIALGSDSWISLICSLAGYKSEGVFLDQIERQVPAYSLVGIYDNGHNEVVRMTLVQDYYRHTSVRCNK